MEYIDVLIVSAGISGIGTSYYLQARWTLQVDVGSQREPKQVSCNFLL